jgi:hypothetical protein
LYIGSSKSLYCIAQLEDRVNLRVAIKVDRVNPDVSQSSTQEATSNEAPASSSRQGGFGGDRFDPAAIFKQSDTDGDGKLSGDEISSRLN